MLCCMQRAAVDYSVLGANPPSTALYYSNYDSFNASDAATLAGPTMPLDGSAHDYTLSFTSFPNVTGCVATCKIHSAVGGGTAGISSYAACLNQRRCPVHDDMQPLSGCRKSTGGEGQTLRHR